MPVAVQWPTGRAYPGAAPHEGRTTAERPWQEFFRDEGLRRLIALTLRKAGEWHMFIELQIPSPRFHGDVECAEAIWQSVAEADSLSRRRPYGS